MNIRKVVSSLLFRVLFISTLLVFAVVCFVFWNKISSKEQVSSQFVDQFALCSIDTAQEEENIERIEFINKILNQPFHFLGQGKQCSAYLSKDGKYVLKFLLSKPLALKRQISELPDVFPLNSLKESRKNLKIQREEALLNSFLISSHLISDETGSLFLHLNPTEQIQKETLLIDRKHDGQVVDLNSIKWVLQKKARHVKLVIAELMCEGKIDEAKGRVNQLFDLLFRSAKHGIIDVDPGLIRNNNVGFLPDRAIYIDTGKLRISDTILDRQFFEEDVKRLSPLYKWLVKYYPILAEHYLVRQNELIALF